MSMNMHVKALQGNVLVRERLAKDAAELHRWNCGRHEGRSSPLLTPVLQLLPVWRRRSSRFVRLSS